MMTINYQYILHLVSLDALCLFFDFKPVNFLSVFEITELFYYCLTFDNFTDYVIQNPNNSSAYLERTNFFYCLEKVKDISKTNPSSYTGKQDRLLELQTYTFKPEFYGNYEKILSMLQEIGLSMDTVSLVASSLAEIVDNAFSHNLGQWRHPFGPLTVCLIQNYPNKRELELSFCDFGVGFLKTLQGNYPSLTSEKDAIELALQRNITGRPSGKGGNGLVFLQNNIFNGFTGHLAIRSTNTLVEVIDIEKLNVIHENLPFQTGVNIFFSLKY